MGHERINLMSVDTADNRFMVDLGKGAFTGAIVSDQGIEFTGFDTEIQSGQEQQPRIFWPDRRR